MHMHSEDMQLMMVEMRCFLVAATDGWAAVARLLKVGLGGVVFQHSSLLFVIKGEEIFRCDWQGRQGDACFRLLLLSGGTGIFKALLVLTGKSLLLCG